MMTLLEMVFYSKCIVSIDPTRLWMKLWRTRSHHVSDARTSCLGLREVGLLPEKEEGTKYSVRQAKYATTTLKNKVSLLYIQQYI